MAVERILQPVTPPEDDEEQLIEITLRPQDFANYIGQERLKKNMQLAIDAAKKRGEFHQ